MKDPKKFIINLTILYVFIKALEGLALMIKDIIVYFIRRRSQ